MSRYFLHKSETRGHFDYGWLDTCHTFSFSDYYDPQRMHFGALRVLNDDVVAPGKGFSTHPHNDMEIVTIPLLGQLEHKDSQGHGGIIKVNDIQHMSAGTGIMHSEYNPSKDQDVNLLQIWIFPREKGLSPCYHQKSFAPKERLNQLQTIVAPDDESVIPINQDAYFSLVTLEENLDLTYSFKKKDNGLYLFVVEGKISVNGHHLSRRDGLGIQDVETVAINAKTRAELLLIEVPMI